MAAERVRVRQESLSALERFITALLEESPEVWHAWAFELARRVVDKQENIPVRFPLFREVLFPALWAGLQNSVPGTARWLAGFAVLLVHCRHCQEQLPETLRSAHGLLQRAIHDDPGDLLAKRRMLIVLRSSFGYVLHELPSGVLHSHKGTTVEQCDEMLHDLSHYERLVEEVGGEEMDDDLIAVAKFHIPAYQRYLRARGSFEDYPDYLSKCEDV